MDRPRNPSKEEMVGSDPEDVLDILCKPLQERQGLVSRDLWDRPTLASQLKYSEVGGWSFFSWVEFGIIRSLEGREGSVEAISYPWTLVGDPINKKGVKGRSLTALKLLDSFKQSSRVLG